MLVMQPQCCQTRKVGILISQCCCGIWLTAAHATAHAMVLVCWWRSRCPARRTSCAQLAGTCTGFTHVQGEDGASVESSTSLLVWVCLLLRTAGFLPLGVHLSNPQRARGF